MRSFIYTAADALLGKFRCYLFSLALPIVSLSISAVVSLSTCSSAVKRCCDQVHILAWKQLNQAAGASRRAQQRSCTRAARAKQCRAHSHTRAVCFSLIKVQPCRLSTRHIVQCPTVVHPLGHSTPIFPYCIVRAVK